MANQKAAKVQKHLEDHQREITRIQVQFQEVFSEFSLYENRIKHSLEIEEYKKEVINALRKLWDFCATIKNIK